MGDRREALLKGVVDEVLVRFSNQTKEDKWNEFRKLRSTLMSVIDHLLSVALTSCSADKTFMRSIKQLWKALQAAHSTGVGETEFSGFAFKTMLCKL